MKKIELLAILLIVQITSALAVSEKSPLIPGEVLAVIQLQNPLAMERSKELIAIPYADLSKKLKDKTFKIINGKTREEIIYQVEYKGSDKPQNILVQVDMAPNEAMKLEIKAGKPSDFSSKTFARYVPERKDDFAWENNKVAFRMYGKALESTNENAYGIDVWSKRTENLIIDKWYKGEDYHTDHGEGLDYYSVGYTLGAGDLSPYVDDSIYFSKNYRQFKVLDNGPLRSTFTLTYAAWKVEDVTLTATKTISLDADSHLNRIEDVYKIEGENEVPAVIGIVKREAPGDILLSEKNGIMGYWEPEIGEKGITGVGCVLVDSLKSMTIEKGHLLSKISMSNNKPIVYYAGAAWNKAGEITSASEWFDYLENFSEKQRHSIQIKILK